VKLTTKQIERMRQEPVFSLRGLCFSADVEWDALRMRLNRGKEATDMEGAKLGLALYNSLPESWLRSVMMERGRDD